MASEREAILRVYLREPAAKGTSSTNTLFYIAYVVWILNAILNTSFYARYLSPIYLPLRLLCVGAILLTEFLDARITKRLFIGYLLARLIAMGPLSASESVLVDGIIFIVCGRKRDFRRIARLSLITVAVTMTVIIVSSLVGVIPNYVTWTGGRFRAYIGFRYALYPSDYAFLVTLLSVYLLGDRIRLRHTLALFAANTAIYAITTSRISYYLSVFVLVVIYALKLWDRRGKKRYGRRTYLAATLLSCFFIFGMVVSWVFASNFRSDVQFLRVLDSGRYLGGRLAISQNALNTYGVHPFGREIHFNGAAVSPLGVSMVGVSKYNYIDNMYIKALVNYGAIFIFLYIAGMTAVAWRLYWAGERYLVIVLCAIAIHSIIDNAMLYLYYDTFLFLLGKLILEQPPKGMSLKESWSI